MADWNLLLRSIRERFHPLFYLRKLSIVRLLLSAADVPIWLSVPGVSFKVRGYSLTHGLAFAAVGSQEPNCEALALTCMKRFQPRSFWDVGANIGHYSWILKSADPRLKVILFEPLPKNADLIAKTIERNALSDVSLVVAGVSDHSGKAVFHTNEVGGATSSLESDGPTFEELHWGAKAGQLDIQVTTIEEQRVKHGVIDFMKIDTEGHEEAVVRGALQTIEGDQPVLFIECNHTDHSCLAPLEKLGYTFVDADRLSRSFIPESMNYFGFPSDSGEEIDGLLQEARLLSNGRSGRSAQAS